MERGFVSTEYASNPLGATCPILVWSTSELNSVIP